jgi:DNA-binding transcriptional ArsR family regulator
LHVVQTAAALLPIFRSNLQGKVLALLYAQPRNESSLTSLAARTGAHVATVQREITRLEKAGIVSSRRVGNTRMVAANLGHAYAPELSALALKAFGPPHVLAEAYRHVPGIELAFIFGSWAERFAGTAGPPPRDLDIVIVGAPDPDEVYEANLEAGRRLGFEVNAIVRSPAEWERGSDEFIQGLKDGPLVPIEVREHG